jgi:raffinose/stachyose/melibiose transport system permease protein
MKVWKFLSKSWVDIISLIVIGTVFLVPFAFILLTASKTSADAALFEFSWPSEFRLFKNVREVMTLGNNRMFLAMWNTIRITVFSVLLLVIFSALVAYVMQRRLVRAALIASTIMLAGLISPPAVVPTIFLLQWLGIYKTLFGLIMIEVAIQMPFAILVFRAFMASIPREIDEAATIDGASPLQIFFSVILPLLRPAIVTVIVVSAVTLYNDFTLPLYFLPGAENVTVQLTLYQYMSQFASQWNLLFTDVVVITIPPLIMYIFFQRQIVSGMTAGSIHG